jgi:hypothetical protein
MTIDEMIKSVDALCDLKIKLNSLDFARKDEASQYIGWAILGLTETICHKGLGIEA